MGYLDMVGTLNEQHNRDFLREHPGHWLALTHTVMHGGSDRFATTGCAVTAHATMWRIGIEVDSCVPHDYASLRDAVRDSKLAVAEVDGGDHWFVIVEGHIVESWWKKYGPRVFRCTEDFLREYENQPIEYLVPNKHLF